jgi:hypothetical protein
MAETLTFRVVPFRGSRPVASWLKVLKANPTAITSAALKIKAAA